MPNEKCCETISVTVRWTGVGKVGAADRRGHQNRNRCSATGQLLGLASGPTTSSVRSRKKERIAIRQSLFSRSTLRFTSIVATGCERSRAGIKSLPATACRQRLIRSVRHDTFCFCQQQGGEFSNSISNHRELSSKITAPNPNFEQSGGMRNDSSMWPRIRSTSAAYPFETNSES